MPLYEYVCPKCGNETEELKSHSEPNETSTCPECGSVSERTLSGFAVGSSSSSNPGFPACKTSCNLEGG